MKLFRLMLSGLLTWGIVLAILSGCSRPAPGLPTAIASPADSISGEPHLFTAQDGSVYLSWVQSYKDSSVMRFSKLEGNTWSAPHRVDSGWHWFVNWADYPMLAAEGTHLMASFLNKHGTDKYAYDVVLCSSTDGGKRWGPPTVLHDDGLAAEHGFTSFAPWKDNLFVSWLDGRNTVKEGMEHDGAMQLRGAVLTADGTKLKEWLLDDRTCDCCQTAAVVTDNGPVVFYRDRSPSEVRDLFVVRWQSDGWTHPAAVASDGWEIKGCPVNGPRADASGNDIAMAWFASPNNTSKVQVVFSNDGGATFTAPVRVDNGEPIGRVDIVLIQPKLAYIIWMEGGKIYGALVDEYKKLSETTIAATGSARSAGFPQLTRSEDRLVLAWTDDQSKTVHTSLIMF